MRQSRCTDGAVVEQVHSLQIHLWLAYLNEMTDPRLLAECRLPLSEDELRKLERFQFKRDRHRYLVTRAMVRTVLSKYAEVAPLHWRFVVNGYGKPSIAAEHLAARGIEFNVSHTDGLVVLGVARGREIGVDVENMHTRRVDIEIADRYFAPSEVRALHALSQQLQLRRFFEYWTLKESYIKARGMGLSIPLDQFAFELEGSRIRLTVDPSLGDSAERWTYQLVPAAEEYLTAVCAERDNNGQLKISSVRRWV